MMSLETLPSETQLEVTRYLEQRDLLHLRLLSKMFYHICTPLAFRDIRIELNLQSLKRLQQIASHDTLRLHVKALILRRQMGLRPFPDFDQWQNCLGFKSEQANTEWYSQPSENKRQVYDEYEADVAQALNIRAYLTFRDRDTIRPLKLPEVIASTQNSELAMALESFDLNIAKLSRLETFSHEPGYLDDDNWGTH